MRRARHYLTRSLLLATVLVLLPATLANAAPGNSISIHANGDVDSGGAQVDIGLTIRCTGTAAAFVDLEQSQPETPYPVTFSVGPVPFIACDGNAHETMVTVNGYGYDPGRALATATLAVVGEEPITVQRWIDLRQGF